MGYGRLGCSDPAASYSDPPSAGQPDCATSTPPNGNGKGRRLRLILLLGLAVALIAASAVSAVVVIGLRARAGGGDSSGPMAGRRPTKAISRACGRTRYPALCVDSLLGFPGSQSASEPDLVHISVNLTLRRFGQAYSAASEISNLQMDTRSRAAYEDCLDLLADSVDLLGLSLGSSAAALSDGRASGGGGGGGSTEDVMTWLSAALTNHDTCAEGLEGVSWAVRDQMVTRGVQDLSELVSNCLALFAAAAGVGGDGDFAGVPIQNRRRRLLAAPNAEGTRSGGGSGYPEWMSRKERELLEMPAAKIQADIVVSQDGTGTVRTIGEAIKKAPEHSSRRIVIYVRAGRYEEINLKVGRKKMNLMFVGDGKGKTVITGGKSVHDDLTTFHTASFAATGAGFIARDMTFENSAGPGRHQAVALRVGADHAVIYRCGIIGYQDTLYLHSLRQFVRECDIYGTVDFIFGNAAVVLQNCSIYARKPMPMQKNTITAQNRKDPNQNTGISIHASRILAQPDLEAAKGSFPTYLGRPWKTYSRVVYMQSYLGDHIHPRGWLEWNATAPIDKLYYGEYMNFGPAAPTGQRVKWPGYHVITTPTEASKFTVAQFIYGSSWLPQTGVAFTAGLSS